MARYKLEVLLPVHLEVENLPREKQDLFNGALDFMKVLLLNSPDVLSVVDDGRMTIIIETAQDVDEMLTTFPADKAKVTKLED